MLSFSVLWSNSTVVYTMKIRYSCGATGYTTLLDMNYPLPSIRTLNRRMEHIEFSFGLIPEVFLALSQKENSCYTSKSTGGVSRAKSDRCSAIR